MKKVHSLALLTLTLFVAGLLIASFASARAASDEAESAPANAVPVWCERETVETKSFLRPTCYRADTGAQVNGPNTTIPSDHYFLVTDVFVNPESGDLVSSDLFFITFGQGDLLERSFELQGRFPDTAQAHFTAPQVIVEPNSYLNVDNAGSDSDQTVSVSVSGFLVTDVTYQVLMRGYLPFVEK